MERRSTETRREQILDAFLATMAEQGYAKATIVRVAERAGLNPGLVHYHFRCKQAILLSLLERLVDDQARRMQAIAGGEGAPGQKLGDLIEAILGMGDGADPAAVAAWVSASTEAIRQPEVRAEFGRAIARMQGLVAEMIAEGVRRGDFRVGSLSATACAAALLATIQGYFTLAATAREAIPKGSAASAVKRMAAGLLGTEAL
jgi:TetR/AcrR family transcriptional regulator, transcriptional repressor of bet genes